MILKEGCKSPVPWDKNDPHYKNCHDFFTTLPKLSQSHKQFVMMICKKDSDDNPGTEVL